MVAAPIARIAKVSLDCRVILSCVVLSNNRATACQCSRKSNSIWSYPVKDKVRLADSAAVTRTWALPPCFCLRFIPPFCKPQIRRKLAALSLWHGFRATLVGEPTGGKPNAYGDVRTFSLPNSRLVIRYSTKRLAAGKCQM